MVGRRHSQDLDRKRQVEDIVGSQVGSCKCSDERGIRFGRQGIKHNSFDRSDSVVNTIVCR